MSSAVSTQGANGRLGGPIRPIGVAVVGCGSIANSHFAGWQRLVQAGRAQLEVACDNDPARAQAAAQRFGAHAWATDFEEVVRRPEVEAIDVCLPHHLHLPAILAAARAGKHVLCEKPLVLNLAEAAQAIRACREAGVVLMTANRDRFEPHARVEPNWCAARAARVRRVTGWPQPGHRRRRWARRRSALPAPFPRRSWRSRIGAPAAARAPGRRDQKPPLPITGQATGRVRRQAAMPGSTCPKR